MPRRLYALLPEPGQAIEFAVAEDGGVKYVSGDRVSAHSRDDVFVFVPGTEVGCHMVRLPAQPAEQLRKSAAYALEDEIAVAVEEVHVAVGQPVEPSGARPAYVVDPSNMEAWIDRLRSLDLLQASLIADVSVLPATDLILEAGRHILIASPSTRFAADASFPDDALQALIPSGGMPPRIIGASIARRLGRAADAEPDMPLLLRLAQWAERHGALTDLRQGPFAQNPSTDSDLRSLRPLLAGGAVAFALFVASTVLEASALSRLQESLDRQARSIYSAAYPGAPVPDDLSAVIRAQSMSAPTSRLGFLELSALLYEALPEQGFVTIQGLRFDASSGRLVASMSYPDYGSDIDIKSRLEARGLAVTLGDSRKQDDRVVGDISLESGS